MKGVSKNRGRAYISALLLVATLLLQLAYAAPTITLSASEAPPGATVTVTGSGFTTSSTVTIQLLKGSTVVATLATDVPTDASGGFTKVVTVPNVPAGTYTVKATDAAGNSATADFTVRSDNRLIVSPAKPSYSIGETVTITGVNWWVLSEVRIYLNRTDKMFLITSVRTNETGGFNVKVTIPAVKPGTYTWLVTQPSSPNVNKSATFQIEAGIYPTPTEAHVGTVVNIFGAHENFIGKKVCIIFDENGNEKLDPGEILANVTGNEEGIITASIVVPAVRAGTYKIYANVTEVLLNGVLTTTTALSADLTVLPPSITISPGEAPVGGQVTVEGNYFKAGYECCGHLSY
jgi:hypothetical protein